MAGHSRKYKVGDLVVLKSGGPVMTVNDYSDYGDDVRTQWFSGKKLEHGGFPEGSLRPATADDK